MGTKGQYCQLKEDENKEPFCRTNVAHERPVPLVKRKVTLRAKIFMFVSSRYQQMANTVQVNLLVHSIAVCSGSYLVSPYHELTKKTLTTC